MAKAVYIFLLLGLCITLFSCATYIKETGKASYYAGKFIGRKTANGETFRKRKLTAASKTLPFGTRVKVTNLSNGRSVKVRINDRGPFVKGRIIDLSWKAAKRIDMLNAGVVPVQLKYKKTK
ncbi:septal ring lytic transglycosylase RlpA family protein [Arachidicoccus soli]|uniref:Probable endolytic peptidoglycan transglycosylase RlpA n=1 Tax=Arachidicoccus soli TaxID=2341117 RepID=A0A386HTC6_9BACT|nr:septal ring lytic transglycosylase RlpA family protein [Arachidicoccus soli]AYD49187.1 septal ring lytic transglycosylase RlpA family protein [Arachidicoccus soli]